MARNQEKARSMLFKFREAQRADLGLSTARGGRRPTGSADVRSIRECEMWRQNTLEEISKKISKIQDVTLTDFQIRELNDDLNRLLREQSKWEWRIRELGGPDYKRSAPKVIDKEGREIGGARGYKYFGRAKELPGVRELFEEQPADLPPKSRVEMHRLVDADYFGLRDEDDGILNAIEAESEFKRHVATKDLDPYENNPQGMFVPRIPSAKDMELFLMERRKQRLMEKYVDS